MLFGLMTLQIMVFVQLLYAQQYVVLSGYIRDGNTGETLIGATVSAEGGIASQSNEYGFFSLRVPQGNVSLQVQYVGYQNLQQSLYLRQDSLVQLKMMPGVQLDEVKIDVTARDNIVRSPQMGVTKLAMKETANIPVLFGEKDIIKTLQLLPGVQSGGEGSSQLFVRGGAGDQNLVLLDEAVVYNASHLFGFFSTFNSDALKDVSLYKGAIPAFYGGRVSSVLDIRMMDGNDQKFAAEGGIGLIASRLKLEGPIVKDKGSWMISGRRTYADIFLKLSKDEDVRASQLYFYDLNLKGNYRLNAKNTLFVSGYLGEDILQYSDNFHFSWGNRSATLRWNHLMHANLFSNTTLMYSDYRYKIGIEDENTQFTISAKIKNTNLKQDFQYYPSPNHQWRFGYQLMVQQIQPVQLQAPDSSSINTQKPESRIGADQALYVSHDWKINPRWHMQYGLRLQHFATYGPGTFYRYDEEGNAVDERRYQQNEIAAQYWSLEPRWSINYLVGPQHSLKAAYSRSTQTLHQLTNTTSSLPTDTWLMSGPQVHPQRADLYALGYAQTFGREAYVFEWDLYYKGMANQIDLRNGANLQGTEAIEPSLVYGKGRAYGSEWLVRKQQGRWTGWIGYTLSKSERQFDAINEGKWFNARQDKTHDVNVVAMFALSKSWHLSGTFVYSTGQAVTYPVGKYYRDGEIVFDYSARNAHRMPAYHRLDLGANYTKPNQKRWQSSWNFGIYNAYNRHNAYIIDFRESETSPGTTEAYRLALFGIIPSVTYQFKF